MIEEKRTYWFDTATSFKPNLMPVWLLYVASFLIPQASIFGGYIGREISAAIESFYDVGQPPGRLLSFVFNTVPLLYRMNARHIISMGRHLIETIESIRKDDLYAKEFVGVPNKFISVVIAHARGILRIRTSQLGYRGSLEKELHQMQKHAFSVLTLEPGEETAIIPLRGVFAENLMTPGVRQNLEDVINRESNTVHDDEIMKVLTFLDNPEAKYGTFSPIKNTTRFRAHYSVVLSRPEDDNQNEVRMQIQKGDTVLDITNDKYMQVGTELATVSDVWNMIVRGCCTVLRSLSKMKSIGVTPLVQRE
jgi:hypothetical protein